MGDKTGIAWCDATWNPLRTVVRYPTAPPSEAQGWGCQRVSPGCANCYAEGVNARFGTGLAYDARGLAAAEHYLDEHAMTQPLRWRRPRRIFLSSMTDVFGAWVTDKQLDRMFAIMALAPQHTFLVLTKRNERMREYLSDVEQWGRVREIATWEEEGLGGWWSPRTIPQHRANEGQINLLSGLPLPNVWLGVSVEDQRRADERIPDLLATPAAKRFLSCEPLLEAVDLLHCDATRFLTHDWLTGEMQSSTKKRTTARIDWVIAGGESGSKARPCDLAWLRSLRDQCSSAGAAYFCKQLGSRPIESEPVSVLHLRSRHGADPEEWPADLRVQDFPAGREHELAAAREFANDGLDRRRGGAPGGVVHAPRRAAGRAVAS